MKGDVIMSKLVDQERLARLAKALDNRAKAAVAAEEARAKAAEEALQGEVDKINNEENGILAQAKAHVAEEIEKVNGAAESLEGRVDALEADAPVKQAAIEAAQAAADQAQEEVDAVEERAQALEDLVGNKAAEGVEAKGLCADVAQNAADIDALEQNAAQAAQDMATTVQALQAEIDADVKVEADRAVAREAELQGEIDAAEGRLDAVEEDIARLDGAVDVEGSVKKQIKDAIDVVNGAAEALEGRVGTLEGEMDAIEAVVGKAAVEADENGEGAQAATGLHKLIADEDARVLGEAKAYANEKITALVDSAPEAMNTLNELAEAINANKGVYDAYVEQHAAAMAQQKADLQGEIDAVELRADALEAKVGHDKVEGEAPQDATGLFLEVDQARAAADQAQNEVDAVEERMTDAEARLDALEENAEQAATDMANTVTALQAEIDADVKVEADRAKAEEAKIREDFAAADEALHAAIKGEMAAVIQSLVAEITVEGKLRIALGGIEGDEVLVIREQEIPFVTDDEIDAIIAGLDTVEGE